MWNSFLLVLCIQHCYSSLIPQDNFSRYIQVCFVHSVMMFVQFYTLDVNFPIVTALTKGQHHRWRCGVEISGRLRPRGESYVHHCHELSVGFQYQHHRRVKRADGELKYGAQHRYNWCALRAIFLFWFFLMGFVHQLLNLVNGAKLLGPAFVLGVFISFYDWFHEIACRFFWYSLMYSDIISGAFFCRFLWFISCVQLVESSWIEWIDDWFVSAGNSDEVRQVPDGCLAESYILRVEDILRSEDSATVSRSLCPGTIGFAYEQTQRSISSVQQY